MQYWDRMMVALLLIGARSTPATKVLHHTSLPAAMGWSRVVSALLAHGALANRHGGRDIARGDGNERQAKAFGRMGELQRMLTHRKEQADFLKGEPWSRQGARGQL